MRPVLKPALQPLWRSGQTLQIGLDPERAVLLDGLDPSLRRLLPLLDGTRDESALLADALARGCDPGAVRRLLDLLAEAGVLEDAADWSTAALGLPVAARERLAPDLASLSLLAAASPEPAASSAVATMTRRRSAAVLVAGAGRIGAAAATLLAAAGVGRVAVQDAAPVRPGDLGPAGHLPQDLGIRRDEAVRRRLEASYPEIDHRPLGARRPDAALLAPDTVAQAALVESLARDGVPHLYVAVRETAGVVGPLVLPGASACLRCLDLHRTDRDPGWAAVATALAAGRRPPVLACDGVLAATVAGLAALQVLTVLDGAPAPATVGGTLEVRLPDARVRRRSWRAHPACGCTWARAG